MEAPAFGGTELRKPIPQRCERKLMSAVHGGGKRLVVIVPDSICRRFAYLNDVSGTRLLCSQKETAPGGLAPEAIPTEVTRLDGSIRRCVEAIQPTLIESLARSISSHIG